MITNQPVVIDNGSGVIKAGFAGEQSPKTRFVNVVGRPKHTRVMVGALEGDLFVGPKAEQHRGLLALKYPMEHGIVTNWNDMETVWRYIFSQEQLNVAPEEHPLLLTEAPLNPVHHRERAAEILFESFNVPALHIQMQAVLALYSTGRTTGAVLDVGDGVSHVVPIYEGFAIQNGIERVDVAGRDVTASLRLLLRKEGGIDMNRSSEFEILREMKEKSCFVARDVHREEAKSREESHLYVLPDGSRVDLAAARFRAPELLFNPHIVGEERPGVADCVNNAIKKCDMDLRKTLYASIVLSGGSTLFPGFGDRLLGEVKKLAPTDTKIRIIAPQERANSVWIGGSILASLETFRKLWIDRDQYLEVGGRRALREKFF